MPKKPIQLRVEEVDLEQWQRKADEAGESLSEWIRERCNGEDVLGVPSVPMEGRGAAAPERPIEPAKPKSKKSELAEAVAGRTRHPVGCGCFECVQAERFFKAQREE